MPRVPSALVVPQAFQQTWETRYVRGVCRRKTMPVLWHTGAVNSVCFSPDGKLGASIQLSRGRSWGGTRRARQRTRGGGLVDDVEDVQRRDGSVPDRLADGFEVPEGLAELWVDPEPAVDLAGGGENLQ